MCKGPEAGMSLGVLRKEGEQWERGRKDGVRSHITWGNLP